MRPFILRFGWLLAILIILMPTSASALSAVQKQLLDEGIYYFDAGGTTACSTVSGETGTGPLFGLQFPDVANPQDLVNQINDYIANTQPNSPFVGLGNEFVTASQKYNVNPALVVAIANKEESLGTTDQPADVDNHNSFGATGVPGFPTIDGFAAFPSFEASIDPITKYMADTYINDPASPHYSTSVLEMMKNGYTPGTTIDPGETQPEYVVATQLTLAVMHKILDGIAETGASGSAPTTSLDLNSIVSKYGLQSVLSIEVKQIGGSILGSANADQSPTEPASVMKLIIADVFLHTNPSLDQQVTIKASELYSPGSDPVGKSYSLSTVLTDTLSDQSWDTGANMLIDAAGGLAAVNSSAHSLGYTQTSIVDYYNSGGGSNHTTVTDLTKAMENVYTAPGNNYGVAQDALRGENHWGITPAPEASKWGGTSDVTGNSAVFAIGSNKYIITLYINEGQATGSTKIANATEDILALLNSTPPSFTPGSNSATQCQSTSSYQAGANGYDLTGANAMAHFYQCDPAWGDQSYGPRYAGDPAETICQSGCGITSLAMVVDTLANVNETPLTLANKYGNTYHLTGPNGGTSFGLWPVAANDYHLQYKDLGKDLNQAAAIIRQGGLVIISVNAGYFTSVAHLMVLRAVDNQGNFYLADPNNLNGNNHQDENQPFTQDDLRNKGNMLELFGFTK